MRFIHYKYLRFMTPKGGLLREIFRDASLGIWDFISIWTLKPRVVAGGTGFCYLMPLGASGPKPRYQRVSRYCPSAGVAPDPDTNTAGYSKVGGRLPTEPGCWLPTVRVRAEFWGPEKVGSLRARVGYL